MVRLTVCGSGDQFEIPAVMQFLKHTQQTDKARGIPGRIKYMHQLHHFIKQPLTVEPDSILAFL